MENDWLKINGMHDGASAKIFELAARLRSNMTIPERKLWNYLRNKPLGFKFRRQHPIGRYVLDFYCHRMRISIEIDGVSHDSFEQKFKDQKRTSYLKGLGIREFRFKNEDIINNIDNVKLTINDILDKSSL